MESNIEIAQSLFQQNKYQETIDTCNQILASDTNSVEAIKLIAKSSLATRKIDDARLYFNKALNIQSNDYEVIKDLGNTYKAVGDINTAKSYYQKAIKINSSYAPALTNLGSIELNTGNKQEALSLLIKATESDHQLAPAWVNLAHGYFELGKRNDAEIACRKAIELNPNLFNSHFLLANILIGQKKLIEAEISLRKTIEIKPDLTIAHSNLGSILIDLGKLKDAELSTRKAIELNPDLAEAHYNLGSTLETIGNRQEAISHWKKAVELKPEDEKSVIALAHNLCYEKKYELALKYLSKNKSNSSQGVYLGCLLSLDREKDFNKKYKELVENKACNADIGGIVEHANIIYGNKYKSPFCNEAIKHILIDKINEDSFSESHLNELISYHKISKKQDRPQGLLTNGIQTSGNLFLLDYPFIKSIKKALEIKIEKYKRKFKDSGQGFINNWPENYELRSWMISMKTGGFLKPHNHEYGWITGSFYLQIPKYNNNNNDSGNIAFSYQGPKYPKKDKKFNLTIKKIETRDICIFPSSLFHHTIPFRGREERICFVFDLVQK